MALDPYSHVTRVSTDKNGLTDDEVQRLQDHLAPDGRGIERGGGGDGETLRRLFDIFLNSHVVLPIAGALGKSVLDVVVDRVKKWLETLPEDKDHEVKILGPDYQVVRIVKTGKKIQTSKRTWSVDNLP